MRGVFGERELEQARPGRDVELTLGFPSLMLIFFGLVLVCGICFGLGYNAGHRETREDSVAQAPASAGQAVDSAALKPTGNAPASAAASPAQMAGNQQPADASNSAGTAVQGVAAAAVGGSPDQLPQVKPAFGSVTSQVQAGPPPSGPVGPAMERALSQASAPAGTFMVQIAAVSQSEDADVLVSALRRHGYAVTGHREPLDGLIHVKIGPFKTRDEAETWRQKLLNDGYNAILQP